MRGQVMFLEFDGRSDQVVVERQFRDGTALVRFVSGATLSVPAKDLRGHLHRTGDRETAVAAANAYTPDRLTEDQFTVLASLAAAGPAGMTDDDHESVNRLRGDSAGKRRLELVRKGLAISAGTKRMTRRHRAAEVWQITTAGEEFLAAARARGVHRGSGGAA